MRLPISMIGLGCILLITRTGGSYGLAGAVSATFWLVSSVASPELGRLADRHGQARVVAITAVLEAAAILALVGAMLRHAPPWVLFASAALIGVGYVSVGTLIRARWSHATLGTGLGHTAYSWESVLDEVIFITGPVLVTLLATRVAPAAGLLVGAAAGHRAAAAGGRAAPRPVGDPAAGAARADPGGGRARRVARLGGGCRGRVHRRARAGRARRGGTRGVRDRQHDRR